MSRLVRTTALGVALAALVAGCGYGPHRLTRDPALSFTEPAAQETISLPYTFSWEPTERADRYVVLFDATPMKPGSDLLSLVPKSDPCRSDSSCPTPDWLTRHSVYVVERPQVTVDSLQDRSGGQREHDLHTVTVVLLDAAGHRVGEFAIQQEFIVRKGTS